MAVELEVAQKILLHEVQKGAIENVRLEDCWHRVLGEEILADMDFPPFDRSPLDGYAVLAEEVTKATMVTPVGLKEIDSIAAGEVSPRFVQAGTACRIMTGAPIPPGATGVVRLEDTRVEGKQVHILAGDGAGKNICRKGEELQRGEPVIAQGALINSGVMGMLAVLGHSLPKVYCRPKVALIATGSEIVPVAASLADGKIRNSNSYMLSAQVQEAGGLVCMMGEVRDDLAQIISLLTEAASSQVVITTGGASVGDYDLIGEAYKKMGIRLLFDRVRMKPGMPVLAGVKDSTLFVGLSGNPAAAAMSFEQLVRPVLLKMGGRTEWWRPRVQAVLTTEFRKASESRRFVWARCRQGKAGLEAEPLKLTGNGMLKSAMHANAVIVIPENSPALPAGSMVDTILLS